jgi:CheY-like chemotaxis protein
MALQSLLLTDDSEARRQVRTVLRDLGIGVEICARAAQASDCLRRRHFDVAILDSDAPGAGDVIGQLRTAPSSRAAPLFLIGPASGSAASLAGQAEFVLARPLTLEETWRTLRGARQQMESAMLGYFRVRTDISVLLLRSDGSTVEGRVNDVAQGGLGLQAPTALCREEIFNVRLELPGCRQVIEGPVEVVWADPKGKAGLRFLNLEEKYRSALEAWIAEGLGQREFAFVFNSERDVPKPILIAAADPAS